MKKEDESAVVPAIAPGDPLPPWCVPLWDGLAARAANDTLPHALLLCGPAGLGKRALADAFVRARLCDEPRRGEACGSCRACRLLAAGSHPDRTRVQREPNPKTHVMRKEIVVDQIRGLSSHLAMASQRGGWQLVVIDPADVMNAAAQNALLKTLEEPSPASLILLVADQPTRLSATIRSRCQRVDFVVPDSAVALAWLEGRGVGNAEAALSAAGGNPGAAWQWLEQGGMQRRQEVARDLLSLAAGRARPREIGKSWAADEPQQRLEQAARLLEGALRGRVSGSPARFDPGWDEEVLANRFAEANRLRALLNEPLRSDLALFEWLDGLPAAPMRPAGR